jgi:hypothetical protein
MDLLLDEIAQLNSCWYELIANDVHKDNDCHWCIETRWSYGYSPIYTVIHSGHIFERVEEECESYEEALLLVKAYLQRANTERKSHDEANNLEEY